MSLSAKREIYLVLDNIRSRENVGSIFRTADGAGVRKIFLCGITPIPEIENPKSQASNPKQISNNKSQIQNQDRIAKTALGAEKWVPWEYHKQTWQLLKDLKTRNVQLIALEQTKNSIDIFSAKGGSASGGKFKPKFPLALIVGNEVKGISAKILKYCDKVVEIPMFGKKESLNVSVAVGVALYTVWSRFVSRKARLANRGSAILKARRAG